MDWYNTNIKDKRISIFNVFISLIGVDYNLNVFYKNWVNVSKKEFFYNQFTVFYSHNISTDNAIFSAKVFIDSISDN